MRLGEACRHSSRHRHRHRRRLRLRLRLRLRRLPAGVLVACVVLATLLGCATHGPSSVPGAVTSTTGAGDRPVPTAHLTPRPDPPGDGFYQPPAPLPVGVDGDVLWSRTVPTPASFAGLADRVVQVLYLSTGALGAPTAVSGTVLVPARMARGTPILGYAPGTQGLGDACAASRGIAAGVNASDGALADALRRGWVVAVPDYQGLGTPGEHTYVVGPAEGHALLDSVRAAARVVPAVDAAGRRPVGLTGYSQGGGAAMWAAVLAPTYAPDLALRGVAAGGVPADLADVQRNLDGRPGAGLALAAAAGLDAAYPDLRLGTLLTPHGREVFSSVRSACAITLVIGFGGTRIADLTTTDPLTLPRWRARLAENTLDGRKSPRVPVYLYQAVSDSLVPFGQAARLRADLCARRVAVTWVPFPGDHIDGVARSDGAMRFLADRFSGAPVGGNC
jgi:hypothetical protein